MLKSNTDVQDKGFFVKIIVVDAVSSVLGGGATFTSCLVNAMAKVRPQYHFSVIAGLPVIASDKVGAGVDLVIPGETGEIFASGDVERLSKSLCNILTNNSTADQMSQTGKKILDKWNRKDDPVEGYYRALNCGRKVSNTHRS